MTTSRVDVGDLARRAAHDPGHREDTGRVGDDERLRVEGPFDVVERHEALTGERPADDEPAVVDRRRVEGMGRLAELEHDVIARVDDVAHRAHAGRLEADLDPVR